MTAAEWPGRPFQVDVAQDVLDDLRERLLRTRFPQEQAGPDWATGTPLRYAGRLRDHWLTEFDWREWERKINALDHRIVTVRGIDIHVVLKRGSGKQPLPLLMTNGWPGSFLELIDVAERLARPERFGGDEEDGFTVVIASIPGYGFSRAPAEPLSPDCISWLWSDLMAQLGLTPYVAYGSDWGSLITARLALNTAGVCGRSRSPRQVLSRRWMSTRHRLPRKRPTGDRLQRPACTLKAAISWFRRPSRSRLPMAIRILPWPLPAGSWRNSMAGRSRGKLRIPLFPWMTCSQT